MNEEMLIWMNRTYPDGFYCADLTNLPSSDVPVAVLSTVDTPILLYMKLSQLQDLVGGLMEQGLSPNTPCLIPEQNISGTLGNIALKTRTLELTDVFLVITE